MKKEPYTQKCVGVILIDWECKILYINPCARDMLKKHINGDLEFFLKSIIKPHVKESLEGEKGEVLKEISLKPYIGKDVILELIISCFNDPITSQPRCLITILDITSERENYSILSESEELFRNLAESTNVAILVFQENKWIFVNRATEDITGYSREELYKMNFWDVVHPDFRQLVKERGLRRQRGENIPPYEFKIIRKDGKERWVLLGGSNLVIKGRPAAIVSAVDITSQKILEEELRKREQRYRSILENMEEGYFETDLKGNFTFFNRALVKLSEVDSVNQLLHLNYRKFAPPHSAKKMYRVFSRVYKNKRPEPLEEFEVTTFTGKNKIVELSVRLIRDNRGNPKGFSGIVRDVTEKKKWMREALKNYEYYQGVFENTSGAIAIIDEDFLILNVNKSFENVFRINKSIVEQKRFLYEFIMPESINEFLSLLEKIKKNEKVEPLEIKGRNSLNQGLELFCSLSRVELEGHIIVSFVDLTTIKEFQRLNLELEEQLKRSQKMEGIGLLASGVAHDFNNILQGIYSNICMLDIDEESDSKRQIKENIEKFIRRGANIINELLVYARSSNERFAPTNVNQTITDIATLFMNTLPGNINIELDLDKDIKNIHGDPVQIQQIIMNLVTNAVDAIEDNGGEIIISTQNVIIKETHTLPRGEYVCIKVKDTGKGISKELIEKIFDPFFTTKNKGKGTGLGLSIVKKIVEEHNGYVFCSSIPGKGTTFKIYFPSITTGKGDVPSEHKHEIALEKTDKRGLNILIIEDEDMILETSSTFLQENGFNVTGIMSGKRAMETFEKTHKEFDVVILDMNLPEISGVELLNNFLKIDPHKKVILSTGYSKDIVDKEKLKLENIRFLQKPYSLKELLATVLDILN